ncbi:MAG: hypothetical protein Q7R75_02010 [bacterium]|nr:hypothetical protein [bacterium]
MNRYKTIVLVTLIATGGLLSWLVFKNNGEKIVEPVSSNQYAPNQNTGAQTDDAIKLEEQTNSEGGLSISIQPVDFSFEKPVQLEITFTTHQGDIDINLTNQALLIDERNNQLKPISWSGGNGGHHLRGILVFPSIPKENSKMTLVIKDIYGVKERTFLWSLI